MMTVNDTIILYHKTRNILAPTKNSIAITKELWEKWQNEGVAPPDIEKTAAASLEFEKKFFDEVVLKAKEFQGKELNIAYLAVCLADYNFYAVHCSDGYLVLLDDYFLQFLFFISFLLVFSAQQDLPEEIRSNFKREFSQMFIDYFDKKIEPTFHQEHAFVQLMNESYELSEFSNYFFASLKTFILSYEIGHHALNHMEGKTTMSMTENGQTADITVDKRIINQEYEADEFGYSVFSKISETEDDSVYYAFAKYRFYFAPVFLFHLFSRFDRLKEELFDLKISHTTHPNPLDRAQNLANKFNIELDDPLYINLLKAMDDIICFDPDVLNAHKEFNQKN